MVARALAAAVLASLLVVSGAGASHAVSVPRGGTVVVEMNSLDEPACLGWASICLENPQWRDKVLARPFRAGPNGYRNDLVAGYSFTKVPFTVTFRIRPQARWSDGVPISAQDFVFAYRTYRAHTGLPKNDAFRTAIHRVRAVDVKTVKFFFGARYGDWRELLNVPPLPEHVLRGQDLDASADFWRNGIVDPRTGDPIGSGPFLTGPWVRGDHVALVRNTHYWGSHAAYLDRIVLRFVPGSETEQALSSGAFDLGVVATPAAALQSHPGFEHRSTLWGSWEHFEIRVGPGGNPALQDRLVRQAIAYGIDRSALVRSLFGAGARVLDNTIYLTNERPYRPNWARYRHRPAYSRSLLVKAGCRIGSDGIYVCSGEPLRLRFMTSASGAGSVRQRALELVGTQLRRVGIEVRPVYVPPSVLFGPNSPLASGDFDVALFQYTKTVPDEASSTYRCPPTSSFSGYCSRLVTRDIDQLDRIVDPLRRTVVANRVDRRLAAAVPAIPLYQFPLTYVARKGLRGVVPNGYTFTPSGWSVWNAEDWWLEQH